MSVSHTQDERDASAGPAGKVIGAAGAITAVYGATSAARGVKHRMGQVKDVAKAAVGAGDGPKKRPKHASIRKGGLLALAGAAAYSVGHHMANRPYKHHTTRHNENT